MTSGRARLVRAVLGLAVGGLLVWLAAGRVWCRKTVQLPAGPRTQLTVTGHSVEASLPALGIAMVALAAAVLATRGLLRRVIGVIVVVVAAIAVAVSIAGRGEVSSALEKKEIGAAAVAVHGSANGWWVLAAIGAVLALLAGVATVIRGPAWAAMGAKYDAPSAPKPTADPDVTAWDALDRGEDPTA